MERVLNFMEIAQAISRTTKPKIGLHCVNFDAFSMLFQNSDNKCNECELYKNFVRHSNLSSAKGFGAKSDSLIPQAIRFNVSIELYRL